jgi:hypothetical protein
MKRAGLVVAALSVVLSCTEGGRSVVLVDLSAQPGVTGIDSVIVHITQGGRSLHHADVNGSLPQKVGVYLPKSVSGDVNIEVCAFTGGSMREVVQATNDPATATVTVTPGATVGPANVVLEPRTPPAVCGGTTGLGGSGGASGSGGGGAGAGGMIGLAGSGGTGGSTSLAGRGGTTGLAGRGGAGGTATGGAAGRGGTTGAAGTGGGDWRTQSPVGTGMSSIERDPSVAVAFNGKAVVVFERDGQIYASCYDPAGPLWSGAVPIGGSGVYQKPVVAVDGAGRFTAMWTQGSGSGFPTGAWSATTSTDCTMWTAGPNPLSSNNASEAALGVNSDGLAIAAWVESGGSVNARVRSSATTDWFGAATIQLGANVTMPAVAMGTVSPFAVWQQAGSSGLDTIYFNRFVFGSGSGWQSVTPVPADASSRAYAPAMAVHGDDVIVTYLHQKLTTVELWARRWFGGQFMPAQMIASSSTIDATVPPSVTLDDDGTATVVWAAPSGTLLQVQASRAAASATSWTTMSIETDNQAVVDMGVSQAPMPTVRGDGKGNVFVIRRKRATATTRFDLFARKFPAGGTMWGPEMKIDAVDMIGGNVASVFNPVLGINGSGVAVAAWYYGGTNVSPDVYAVVTR